MAEVETRKRPAEDSTLDESPNKKRPLDIGVPQPPPVPPSIAATSTLETPLPQPAQPYEKSASALSSMEQANIQFTSMYQMPGIPVIPSLYSSPSASTSTSLPYVPTGTTYPGAYAAPVPAMQPGSSSSIPQYSQQVQQAPPKVIKLTPQQESTASLMVTVPNDKVGLIIGKNGMTVKGIQTKHSCTVQIPLGPDEDDPSVRTLTVIAQTMEEAERGREEVLAVCTGTQGPLPTLIPPGYVETFCTIPNDKVGLVIGKGGMNIKQVQQDTGCNVQIPGVPDPGSNPPTRTLSICGPPASIQRCIDEVSRLVYRQLGSASTFGLQSVITQQSSPFGAQGAIPGGAGVNLSALSGVGSAQDAQNLSLLNNISSILNQASSLGSASGVGTGTSAGYGGYTGGSLGQISSQTVTQQQPQHSNTEYKYTREEWQQWKLYYKQFGQELADDPPPNQRATNY